MNNYSNQLFDNLKILVSTINNVIDNALVNQLIKSIRVPYVQTKFVNFQYTNEGVSFQQVQYANIQKKEWNCNSRDLLNTIRSSEIYNLILNNGYSLERDDLDEFILYLIYQMLDILSLNESATNVKLDELKIERIIRNFLKDISQEPINFKASIALEGITLQVEKIEFDVENMHIVLRQTQIEDLEQITRAYPGQTSHQLNLHRQPSAILIIESEEDFPFRIQEKVEQAVSILRLFKVGEVDYIYYKMESEAVLGRRGFCGTFSSLKNLVPSKKYLVTSEDVKDLKDFWRIMINLLPENLYNLSKKELNHLTIAYARYCDALLRSSAWQEKVTNGVIGLESLIVFEDTEIAYRFKMRSAKIMSLFGYSAIEVKKDLKLAYDLRSAFVHGDDNGLEKKSKSITTEYSSDQNFLIKILEYLRTFIIIMIFLFDDPDFIKEKNGKRTFKKQDFLAIVDDSFIDPDKEQYLRNILNSDLRRFLEKS
jgi:hypothetical protein